METKTMRSQLIGHVVPLLGMLMMNTLSIGCTPVTGSDSKDGPFEGFDQRFSVIVAPSGRSVRDAFGAGYTNGKMQLALAPGVTGNSRAMAGYMLEGLPGLWALGATTDLNTYTIPKPSVSNFACVQSDTHVMAAALSSWAAEAHARAGLTSALRDDIDAMRASLDAAWSLCDTRTLSRRTCSTYAIIDCPQLRDFARAAP